MPREGGGRPAAPPCIRPCLMMSLMQDSTLWAHRLVLSTVSPFLKALLEDFERRGEDVITIFLPDIKVLKSP